MRSHSLCLISPTVTPIVCVVVSLAKTVFPLLGVDAVQNGTSDWREEAVSSGIRRCCQREHEIPAGIRVTPGVLVSQEGHLLLVYLSHPG